MLYYELLYKTFLYYYIIYLFIQANITAMRCSPYFAIMSLFVFDITRFALVANVHV